MSIKVPQAKIYKTFSVNNLKKQFQPRNIVSAMASDGFLPVIALEAFVEAGRTYQAYRRGGFDEARERITEEFSGAVFWLGGVTGLNWLFEKLGQKVLQLPKKTVDIAKDDVRNPLVNFLKGEKRTNKNASEITQKLMARFKFTKVIASVLIANAFIGFVLPKINQAITRSYHRKDKQNQNNNPQNDFVKRPEFSDFVNGNEDNKEVSFSGRGLDLLALANNFENKRNWKLLSVDAGTCSGRVYSARNNDERVEIAFRDLSSIYFYMFNMANMNKWLNQLEQGKGNSTRLDPSSAQFATEYMSNYLDTKSGQKVSVDEFAKEFLGAREGLPEVIKSKFNGKNIINLADFKVALKDLYSADKVAELEAIADKMSELQPQLKGESILTIGQAKDIINGGHINNPEFLKEFYKNAFGSEKFMDKYKYVAQDSLDSLKSDLTKYVESIVKKAKEANVQEITSEALKKASRNNFRMNAINWGAGFAISAAFLSTFIPKLQYLITKKRTGQDGFPGTKEFREQEPVKNAA